MIVTRTPFRVTLGGGGTDLPSYYEKHGGMIFAMAIDKYMYVTLNRPCVDEWVRIHYTKSEQVEHARELQHELAREALLLHGIDKRVEISSLADIPAGTGVGSSSCYLVGLLRAIHAIKGDHCSLQALAEEACQIELNILKKGIGKQDQYMAAFGGLTFLEIQKNGDVTVKSVEMNQGLLQEFVCNTHIYYTGVRRGAEDVLSEQNRGMKTSDQNNHVANSLHKIKELGYRIYDAITAGELDQWGLMLDEHWQNKKKMSAKISLTAVDEIYDFVKKEHHVLGGKVIGAGGGGFLMLYCEKDPLSLERFMERQGMKRLYYNVSKMGSTLLSNFMVD